MRLPNLNALRMFDAASRHLTFRAAAEELHLTQGAVAQQVRGLEADLGCALFTRHARGLALTDAGRAYHGPVQRALALIETATHELRPQATRIVLSVPPSLASKWLVPRLGALATIHPGVDLQIVASDRLADFRRDGVDLAIRQGAPPRDAGLTSRQLGPLDLRAVANPDPSRSLPATHGLADLAVFPLIQDSHVWWRRLLAAPDLLKAARLLQVNQTALAIDAAISGQGIALAPEVLVAGDVTAGRLEVLWSDTEPAETGFHLVHPRDDRTSDAREAIIAWLVSEWPPSPGPDTVPM